MIKLFQRTLRWLLPALALCASYGCRPASDQSVPGGAASLGAADEIFREAQVLEIDIEIPRAGINALRHTQWGDGQQRPKVRATVREGGTVYRDVSLHLKGAAGSFRPVDDRPGMTLQFDKFVPRQTFHGLEKISLNNSVQDPSGMSEKICRELFATAGVPVPRSGHALVRLNGRDLGMYVLLEGANKQFLRRYFGNVRGNLYDGGFVRDVSETLQVNSGDHPEDRSGLAALLAAERQTRRTRTLTPLEAVLDVDRFLSMIAVEMLVAHWDGYALNKNNWRLFHDLGSQRLVFIPHGLDQTFGMGYPQAVSLTDTRDWQGRIATAVLGTPEGQRRYRQRLEEIHSTLFRTDQILARVDEVQAGLHPALASRDPQAALNQEHQVTWFKQRVVRRGSELSQQLGDTHQTLQFDSGGVAPLSGWSPSSVRTGEPKLASGKDPEGRPIMIVAARSGFSSGSWRTRVRLAKGGFRFEGRVRVHGVVAERDGERGGAGLRMGSRAVGHRLRGTSDWQVLSCEIRTESSTEVELICELQAVQGEAWFDPGSLRLVRLR